MRKGLRQGARLALAIRNREGILGHIFKVKPIQSQEQLRASAIQKTIKKKQRRENNRLQGNMLSVSKQDCATQAGEAHFTFEERFAEFDHLGHTRESTSRRAPEVTKDRPQYFLPNGMKSAEPDPLAFLSEE